MIRSIGKVLLVGVLAAQFSSCVSGNGPGAHRAGFAAPAELVRADDSELQRAEGCLVVLGSFVDRRRREGAIGEIDGQPVEAGNVVAWLRSAFETELENDAALEVVRMDAVGRGVRIDGEILSIYITDEDGALIANIAMRLNYLMPDGAFRPELAYGSTTIDESASEQPVREVFEVALSDLVTSTRGSLERACMSVRNGTKVHRWPG